MPAAESVWKGGRTSIRTSPLRLQATRVLESGPTSGHGHLDYILQWSVTFQWEDGGLEPCDF